MQLQHVKSTFAGIWMISALLVAVMADVTSVTGLFVVAAFGLLPPLAMLLLWNDPPQTMSESIHNARR